MKVLSDWHTGTPPKPGLWLMRPTCCADFLYGSLAFWTGTKWTFADGSDWHNVEPVEWRGLAFDPEAARLVSFNDGDCWVVKVQR